MKETGLTVNDLKTEDGVLAAFEKVKKHEGRWRACCSAANQRQGLSGCYDPYASGHFGAMSVDKDGNYRDHIFAPETKHVLEFMFKAAKERLL